MKTKITRIILLTTLAVVAGTAYAGASMKAADQAPQAAPDPKKKKAGEECKNSDECQSHHMCSKVADKNICWAPPSPKTPVT